MYYCQFTVTKSCNVYFLSLIGYNSILVEFFSTKQVITMLNQLNPVHVYTYVLMKCVLHSAVYTQTSKFIPPVYKLFDFIKFL